jgi:lysozyme family protein
MADFIKAFEITIIGNEGGYDPGTDEKETYMGIDRGANPAWDGWIVIDQLKQVYPKLSVTKLNLLLSQNINLQTNIKKFYKINYWDAVNLDKVNDQQLANNLFDCSVNQGSGLACKFVQIACNYVITAIKTNIKLLTIDRIIGNSTIAAFNSLPAAQLNAEINAERETSYRHDSEYAEWGKVWEKRLKQYT